jgi:hypothetical protein
MEQTNNTYELKPRYDYKTMPDADLVRRWRLMFYGNPQRFFVYSELRKRHLQIQTSSLLERVRFNLNRDEYMVFIASGNPAALWTIGRRLPRLPKIFALTFNILLLASFLAIFIPNIAWRLYHNYINSAHPEMRVVFCFLMTAVLLLVWVIWPFFSIRFFLTNKRIGYYYSIFNLIKVGQVCFDLSSTCILARDLVLYADAHIFCLRDKYQIAHFCGIIQIIGQYYHEMTFITFCPQGLAFMKLMAEVAGEVGSVIYITDVSYYITFFPIRYMPFNYQFININQLRSYYKKMAEVEGMDDYQRDDEYNFVRELCEYYTTKKMSQREPYSGFAKMDIQKQFDEKYIFTLRVFHMIRGRKIKYAIFTSHRLLLLDKNKNILNSYNYSGLRIVYDHYSIGITTYEGKLIVWFRRNWRLAPAVETLALVTNIPAEPVYGLGYLFKDWLIRLKSLIGFY